MVFQEAEDEGSEGSVIEEEGSNENESE